jgi:Flp pilus assembly protein TadG
VRTPASAPETARDDDPPATHASDDVDGETEIARGHGCAKNDRGYVTAETALLLPILFGIGYALALVVFLAADQIRCADAAWEAARAVARGAPTAQLSDIAARYAPSGAHVSSWTDNGSLTVKVERDQSVASRFLPSIGISATATVPCEPRVDGCGSDSTDVPGRPDG